MPSTKPEKVPNPKAYDEADLFELPEGQTWDTVEIGGIDFAIAVPTSLAGMDEQCKGNEAKAAQLYARALRIDAPAKLDARPRLRDAKDKEAEVRKIQAELYDFDVTAIATRAPRQPKVVELPAGDTVSRADFEAALKAAGVRFTVKQ